MSTHYISKRYEVYELLTTNTGDSFTNVLMNILSTDNLAK